MANDINIPADLDDQVKKIIIAVGGLAGMTPDQMDDDDSLSNDYQFDAPKFALLCIRLQQLVQSYKPSGSIKCDDVSNCDTVGDVIKLVRAA